jgi:hypothetical protein
MNPGSKYYGCEILNPLPHTSLRVGFRILWLWDNDPHLVFIVRRRWFKILWLRYIEPPSPIRVGIQNIVVARYWPPVGFHDVRRRGFKILWPRYIEPPSLNILRVGIQKIWLRDIDLLVSMVKRRGFKILWPRYIEPHSLYILRVGIQIILVVRHWLIGFHG